MRLTRAFIVGSFAIGMMVMGAGGAADQAYPNKPIRIVTSPVGGGSDFVLRIIGQGLSVSLGQSVITDNRPGAVTGETVAKAVPDGYTLLLDSTSFWVAPLLQTTPYDPQKDFMPITLAASSPNVLVIHPSVAANSVSDLVALAKAKPGALNYGSGTVGGGTHLAVELLKTMAGVNIVRVNYKGSGPAIAALIAGEVQMTITSAGSVSSHIKSSRLRALAVTSAQPSLLAPGLPTVAASGLPGYEAAVPFAMFAPAKTPISIIRQLHQEVVRVLNQANVKERFFSFGVDTVGSSPEQLAAMLKADMEKWDKVIKTAGIRLE